MRNDPIVNARSIFRDLYAKCGDESLSVYLIRNKFLQRPVYRDMLKTRGHATLRESRGERDAYHFLLEADERLVAEAFLEFATVFGAGLPTEFANWVNPASPSNPFAAWMVSLLAFPRTQPVPVILLEEQALSGWCWQEPIAASITAVDAIEDHHNPARKHVSLPRAKLKPGSKVTMNYPRGLAPGDRIEVQFQADGLLSVNKPTGGRKKTCDPTPEDVEAVRDIIRELGTDAVPDKIFPEMDKRDIRLAKKTRYDILRMLIESGEYRGMRPRQRRPR